MPHPDKNVRRLSIDTFDYDLPDERIARFPLPQRDRSKLLIYNRKTITESHFERLPEWIPENAMLVFNNTRVIRARILFQKPTGATIEIFCLEPVEPADYAQSFATRQSCVWSCLTGNSKRWKGEKLFRSTNDLRCSAERLDSDGETHRIRFEWDNPEQSFADILEQFGDLPIPPYLNRQTVESDHKDYQTVYSKIDGSVAAPTAGLHFTPNTLSALKDKGIDLEELTLHVGAGTFRPVKSALLAGHEMHAEHVSIPATLLRRLIHRQGPVYAVGTTSVRVLESLYYLGLILETHPDASPEQLFVTQWMPYETAAQSSPPLPLEQALNNIDRYLRRTRRETLTAQTQILLAPGYPFRLVDGMITNFHQPKSTLLLLISAFIGPHWRTIYEYALEHDFRFLSYGDSSLLIR